MSTVLVAYFSATGTTKRLAEQLVKISRATLFEITPEVPYTAADLDWNNPQSRSTLEMKDPDCRPAIVGKVEKMEQYEVVFLGFPLWWLREPSIVDTFLESYDFSRKKIIPFCTSGGNKIGDTAKRIRQLVGPSVKVDGGTRLGGTVSPADLKTWTAGLGL